MPRNNNWIATLLAMALFYGGLAVFNAIVLGRPELCFFRMACGLPCPGCGLTHSVVSMLKGDFIQSLAYCPLMPLLAATLAGALADFLFHSRMPSFLEGIVHFLTYNRVWSAFLLISFFALYIVRMLLFFPNGPYPMVYSSKNYLSIGYHAITACCIWISGLFN